MRKKKLKFIGQHIANGLTEGRFDHLSDQDKFDIRLLLSRVAERSYRRGAQHGVELYKRWEIGVKDIDDWRYKRSLDSSPWLDGNYSETSISRLDMENHCLEDVGLGPSSSPQNIQHPAKPDGTAIGKKFLEFIRSGDSFTRSHRETFRKFRIPSRDFENVVMELVSSGHITKTVFPCPGGGRATITYTATKQI